MVSASAIPCHAEYDPSDAHLYPANMPDGSMRYPTKLFVGGLSQANADPNSEKNITERDLDEFFQQFGKVSEVKFICHHEDGSFRGYAFVTFENPTAVCQVLTQFKDIGKKGFFTLKGVELKIGHAVRKPNAGPAASVAGKRPNAMALPAFYNLNNATQAVHTYMQLQATLGSLASCYYPPITGSPFMPYSSAYQSLENGYAPGGSPTLAQISGLALPNGDSSAVSAVKSESPTSQATNFNAFQPSVSACASPTAGLLNGTTGPLNGSGAAYNPYNMYLMQSNSPLTYMAQPGQHQSFGVPQQSAHENGIVTTSRNPSQHGVHGAGIGLQPGVGTDFSIRQQLDRFGANLGSQMSSFYQN